MQFWPPWPLNRTHVFPQGPATGVVFGHEGPNVLYTCGLDRHLLTTDLRIPTQVCPACAHMALTVLLRRLLSAPAHAACSGLARFATRG